MKQCRSSQSNFCLVIRNSRWRMVWWERRSQQLARVWAVNERVFAPSPGWSSLATASITLSMVYPLGQRSQTVFWQGSVCRWPSSVRSCHMSWVGSWPFDLWVIGSWPFDLWVYVLRFITFRPLGDDLYVFHPDCSLDFYVNYLKEFKLSSKVLLT